MYIYRSLVILHISLILENNDYNVACSCACSCFHVQPFGSLLDTNFAL